MGIVVDKSRQLRVLTNGQVENTNSARYIVLVRFGGGSVTAPAVGVTWLIAILRKS